MNEGYSRLARVLDKKVEEAIPLDSLDLGVMEAGQVLQLDRYASPLPPGSYLSCVSILEPGQRVLAAWVGKTPVIINVVVN